MGSGSTLIAELAYLHTIFFSLFAKMLPTGQPLKVSTTGDQRGTPWLFNNQHQFPPFRSLRENTAVSQNRPTPGSAPSR